MRTEEEMIQMIQDTARKDDRIRAAYLEGSRANPKVPKDMFQDYDVVYIVEETESFQRDKSWIDRFGKRLYMQYPEDREAPGAMLRVADAVCRRKPDGSPCLYERICQKPSGALLGAGGQGRDF